MRKAKIVALLLTVVCMACLFASCGGQSDPDLPGQTLEKVEGNDPADTRSENEANGGQQETTENSDVGEDGKLKIEQSQIFKYKSNYCEGLAFVQLDEMSKQFYCIDKAGVVRFIIEGNYYIETGFYNGYAIIEDWSNNPSQYILCDTQGNIITANDFDGNTFILQSYHNLEMFKDGYLLVRKTTTSFSGSIDEMAIYTFQNERWEKTTDFSDKLDKAYSEAWERGTTYYYNGFAFNNVTNHYIDLKSGEVCEGVSDLKSKVELKNQSDFWTFYGNWDGHYIYDQRDILFSEEYNPPTTPIIDMSQYEETIYTIYDYSDGTCCVTFRVQDSEIGYRYYFTIMDEAGNFKFEPIETNGEIASLNTQNGIYVLRTSKIQSTTQYVEVYDANGKITEIEYEMTHLSDNVWPNISDGVIAFNSYGQDRVYFYTINLEPLF